MTNTMVLSWVTFLYFGAFVFYLFRLVFGKEFWGKAAFYAVLGGLGAHTLGLMLRWKESYALGIGHAPLSNFYESLIFFAWAVVMLYVIVEWRIKNRSLGVFVLPAAFLLMAFASLASGISDRIQPLIPALQSNWLTSHVVTCFMGYAAFTVAFAVGIMYFLRNIPLFSFIPEAHILDELIYQNTVLGFVFLTLGIMTGSVWAHYAWGAYWSWDPKETWSLITWLIYAVMLHARYVRGWRGKRMAVLAIIGFAAVLFTYLGVNYLPGLHSYLQS
ncbi:MAG: c-type cytochrome biogenesis protein CcsB [Deltaproteobacteria bacterium]|nr:c-type cytochrome biogenesis protein CcsB [Deltaproteobacteria bacterium]